jgi:hypothetical protein
MTDHRETAHLCPRVFELSGFYTRQYGGSVWKSFPPLLHDLLISSIKRIRPVLLECAKSVKAAKSVAPR